ncbi:MAG: hypothetical protein ACI9LO_000002 [Planctomycetota bacterium]
MTAAILAFKTQAWVRNSIVTAFLFFFISAFLKLPDIATNEVYEIIFTPISRLFYLTGIPIFGYVYLREQWSEARIFQQELRHAHENLERQVMLRTKELKSFDELKQAILDNAPDCIITVDSLRG